MDIMQAMEERHSVRAYNDEPIPRDIVDRLNAEIKACNAEGVLNMRLITGDPEVFGGFISHYGHFSGVQNYICCVGKKGGSLEQRIGYYGERLVLLAKQLGLDSCWVAMSYSKKKIPFKLRFDQKLVCVIALGYGETHGTPHKSKPIESRFSVQGAVPDWFMRGMEAAMLAPTAVNQQRFSIELEGKRIVHAKATGGPNSTIDLGIVKYHFEQGAGAENFTWTN